MGVYWRILQKDDDKLADINTCQISKISKEFDTMPCFRRLCIDRLGVSHANQISMCLDPHLN